MGMGITRIEGIGEKYGERLQQIGIHSVDRLVVEGADPEMRKKISRDSGIPLSMIEKWVEAADLFRVHGVSTQYAELLGAAGIKSVKEFAKRNPQKLSRKISEVNRIKKLVRKVPSASHLNEMILAAKKLTPIVLH